MTDYIGAMKQYFSLPSSVMQYVLYKNPGLNEIWKFDRILKQFILQ